MCVCVFVYAYYLCTCALSNHSFQTRSFEMWRTPRSTCARVAAMTGQDVGGGGSLRNNKNKVIPGVNGSAKERIIAVFMTYRLNRLVA